jgi:hypothetical protein
MEQINLDNLENLSDGIDFNKMKLDAFVDVNEKLLHPPVAVSIGSHEYKGDSIPNAFGTYGNFSCIVGASKARKSFLKSLVMAAYIGGKTNTYAPDFRSHRVGEGFVLDFDTEQSAYHSQRVFKRVCDLVGGNANFYKPFSLRKYTFRERLEFIEWCIMESEFKSNIGLVSIDGFADLVSDVNDLTQCNEMVQRLMSWTDVSQCHLTGILHTNFGSNRPTGHLGSAVMKKAETVCVLEYGQEATSVKFAYTRGFPIDDFEFSIGGDGLPRTNELTQSLY